MTAHPVDPREHGADSTRTLLESTLAQAAASTGSSRPLARDSDAATPPAPTRSPSSPPRSPARIDVVLQHTSAPPDCRLLPFVQNPDSPASAAFRVLRHKLREVGSPKTIAVTSPNPREGKTSCAIDLAMALAEHSLANVLLVEANFRTPGIAKALGFQVPACFGEQVAAHRKAPNTPWLVVSAFFPNLHVLAVDPASAGQWALNAPAFKSAMDQLKSAGYESIIIDCPHTLGSADVNVIEDSADGVLLTAIATKTSASSLQQTARHLAPTNLLGVVLLER